MALQDPQNDPDPSLYGTTQPGLESTGVQYADDPFLQWFHNAAPGADQVQRTMTEYAPGQLPPIGTPPAPPPPPPPPPQKVGPGGPATEGARDEVAPGTPGGFPPPAAGLAPGALPDAISGAAPATPGALPPPPPDAISGGALPGTPHSTALDQASPQMPGAYRTDAEEGTRLANLAATDPDAYAKEVTAQQVAHDTEQRRLEAAARAKDQQQEQDNYFARQKAWVTSQTATDKLIQDSNALANVKVDPDRWWNSRSTGQKIAGFIAAIAGGLSGNNSAMSMFKDAIDRDVDAQKQDLINRRTELTRRGGLIKDQDAQADDMFHQSEVFRVASWNRVIADMQTQMQNFDPHGTTAMKYAQNIEQARQQQGQAVQAYRQQKFKNDTEAFKANTERMREEETVRKDMADEAAKAAKAGVGTGAATQPLYGTVYKSMNDVPPKDAKLAFPMPMINGQPGGFAIATNEENQKDATHVTQMHSALNYDLDELQKIALERRNNKSLGGSVWDKWRDDNEARYDSLKLHAVNVYAMMIHGKTPSKGVLEEVIKHGLPELTTALESGDTAKRLEQFHNDVDNRASIALSSLMGTPQTIRNTRPHVDAQNITTVTNPLKADPVRGDNGYARFEMSGFGQGLNGTFQTYVDNPGLGGPDKLKQEYEDIAAKQRAAVTKIGGDIKTLEAKPKRTAAEDAQLANNRMALKDRQEALREAEEARDKNPDLLKTKLEERSTRYHLEHTTPMQRIQEAERAKAAAAAREKNRAPDAAQAAGDGE